MVLASLRESAFTEDDAELLTQIGVQVAIAVDNAVNYQRLRRAERDVVTERDRTKLLLEINNAVVSHLDLRQLFRSISESLSRIIPHDGASLTILDAAGTKLHVQALDLRSLEQAPSFMEGLWMPMEGTPEGEAITSGKAVLVTPGVDLNRFHSPWVRLAVANGVKSGCAVPLIAHARTLGALSVLSRQEAAFHPEHAVLLEQCSGQIAIAVSNALNFEKSREAEREIRYQRDRTRLLLEINNALALRLDLRELVEAISSSLQPVLQHDWVGLAIFDRESDKMFSQAVDSKGGHADEGIFFSPEGTVTELAFKTGRPIYIPRPDPMKFPSRVTKGLFDRGLRTLYTVPMTVHGRKLGVMAISSVREDAFTSDDQELFQQITIQVSFAVANALATRELGTLKDKLAQEKLYLENEIRTELNFDEIVGQSPALREVLRLADQVYQLVQLNNTLDTRKEYLNDLLGRDIRTAFRTEQVPAASSEEIELKRSQQMALAQRPEIRQADLNVRRAEYDRRIAKADHIPTVAMVANYVSPFNVDVLPKNVASVGVEVKWKPWDWGRRKDVVSEKVIAQHQAGVQLHDAQSKALMDVNGRFRKLEEARALIDVAQASRQASERRLG